jgi:hypothetical protein
VSWPCPARLSFHGPQAAVRSDGHEVCFARSSLLGHGIGRNVWRRRGTRVSTRQQISLPQISRITSGPDLRGTPPPHFSVRNALFQCPRAYSVYSFFHNAPRQAPGPAGLLSSCSETTVQASVEFKVTNSFHLTMGGVGWCPQGQCHVHTAHVWGRPFMVAEAVQGIPQHS